MLLTTTANHMMETRVGCRNNSYGDGMTYRFKDVVYFEMYELGNLDIYDFCKRFYNIRYEIGFLMENPSEKDVVDFIKELQSKLENFFNTSNLYCLWLTTEDGVKEYYYDEGEYVISKYNIPKEAVIISDLGMEGSLFVSSIHPDEWEIYDEVNYTNG